MQSLIERFGSSIAVAFGLGLLMALIVLPITTNAQTPDDVRQKVEAQQAAVQEKVDERRTTAQVKAEEKKQAAEEKKVAATLKACQQREKKVLNIMSRISDRGQRQLDVFTKISDRTQEFYTTKGYNVANYDALAADVDAKRTAAETAVNTQSELSVTFTCDSEAPKGTANAFKEQLKNQIALLKEYRTAVKNLIVGVKSAQSTAQAGSETETETQTENTETTENTSEQTNE